MAVDQQVADLHRQVSSLQAELREHEERIRKLGDLNERLHRELKQERDQVLRYQVCLANIEAIAKRGPD